MQRSQHFAGSQTKIASIAPSACFPVMVCDMKVMSPDKIKSSCDKNVDSPGACRATKMLTYLVLVARHYLNACDICISL